MQYYDEHNKNENILNMFKTYILKNENNNANNDGNNNNLNKNSNVYINCDGQDIQIVNNRAFIGDEVYVCDNKVVGIKKRFLDGIPIVGILYLDSKMKYNNEDGKTMFLFKPTNKQISHFYITYTVKQTDNMRNIYCVIQFKTWTVYQKLPNGIVLEKIGLVGEKEAEYEHLRIYYGLRNTTIKINKDLKMEHQSILDDLKQSIIDYEVFSIDPRESKDIDDAFHFKHVLGGQLCEESRDQSYVVYEIGIHISCPYYFFKNPSDLDKIMEIGTTIYMPHKIYNMLPSLYSENYASLIEGEKRHALSLILQLDDEYNLVNYAIKPTIVKNINKGNYEDFQSTYTDNELLMDFVNVSSYFFKNTQCKDDSHKLVELWMIFANKTIATHLLKQSHLTNVILRSHKSREQKQLDKTYEDCRLMEYLKIRHENSAKYVLYSHAINDSNVGKESDIDCYTHSKLGHDYYTHFTSPIRRAVDLFIHGLLLTGKDIYEKDVLEEKIENINSITKRSRKLDRIIKRLDFLYKLKETCNSIETFGYIIDFNKEKMSCNIYIPEYNLDEIVYLVHNKFKSIADFGPNDFSVESYTIYCEDEFKTYTLYEKINIRMWVFLSAENIFDKLRIEIID